MKKFFYNKLTLTFKQKILALVCIFGVFLVVFISFFSIRWHSEQMVVQTIHQTQQTLEQLGSNIDNYLDELFRLTLSPYYNDEVMKELETTYHTPEENLEKKRQMERFLSSVMILPRDEILRVYILTDKERYSYTRTPYEMMDYWTYQKMSWYQAALSSSQPVFIPIHSEKVFGNQKTAIVSIARRLRSKTNNQNILGVIKVDADYSVIKSLGDKIAFEYHGGLFMVNNDGDILYQRSNIKNMDIAKELPQILQHNSYYTDSTGQRYICNTALLNDSGIRVIALNSYEDILSATLANISKTVLLVAGIFIIALTCMLVLIRKFFAPLYYVVDAMKQVQGGNLSVQVNLKQKDEIGYLADSFNTMTSHLDKTMKRNADLLTKVYETNYLHKASQYEALCNQIKPHFIHNTLNTISLLIKCGEYQKSVRCIEDLSLFLRGVMQADKEISLETELKLVEAYLSICQTRYGNRLSYHINVLEEHLSMLLPALTIQPIVENAIKHSCEKTSRPICISITSFGKDSGIFHIQIKDDGIGIPNDIFLSLLNQMEEDVTSHPVQPDLFSANGIGLLNVHRRLQLKYGVDSGLLITSDSLGTTVEIVMKEVFYVPDTSCR